MRNRFECGDVEGERQMAQSAPGGDNPKERAYLLLQRLKVEAVLRHNGVRSFVAQNLLLLVAEGFCVVIQFACPKDRQVEVRVRAHLGEVMLVNEARSFLAGKATRDVVAEVGEDGAVTIAWRGTFAVETDVAAVEAGLRNVCAAVRALLPALREDYYLKSINVTATGHQQ
jgi:hypothetical protein